MDIRSILNLLEDQSVTLPADLLPVPIPYLYHATKKENLPSIKAHGLLTRYYGKIHGGMEFHPPKPALYLSRRPTSNNLHTSLFNGDPIILIKINTRELNSAEIWPDDAIYSMFTEGDVFESASQVSRAFGIGLSEAKKMFAHLETATGEELPRLLQPCWRWYLMWSKGGEIAYTADIPSTAIVSIRETKGP